jgi:hypothetical protein
VNNFSLHPTELNVPGLEPHISNSPESSSDEAEVVVQQSARVAPVRPKFSSSMGSDEESEGKIFNAPIV